jgi:hypothetical protein
MAIMRNQYKNISKNIRLLQTIQNMMPPDFIIQSFQRDIPTWEKLMDRVEQNNDLTLSVKAIAKEVIQFFKYELGIGFFDTCGYHPLMIRLNNIVPWQIYELKEWVDTLK